MNFQKLLKKLIDSNQPSNVSSSPIAIVSGLPRSGTSMMMKMLEAGGMPVLIDGLRKADSDNPKGYYEFERVKQLDKGDITWLNEARGKAVKVIYALLEHLPLGYDYQILFMHRNIEEIIASQEKMLVHRSEETSLSNTQLKDLLTQHVNQVKMKLAKNPQFRIMDIDYNAVLENPDLSIQQINNFLNNRLNEKAMLQVVDSNLYRNRK